MICISERWLLEVLKKAFLLLPKHLVSVGPGCKVGKMTGKTKKKYSKMIAMGFFLVNGWLIWDL